MEGGGDIQDGDGDRLNRWENIVANIILGTEPNASLAYAPVLELRHPTMSMVGVHRGQLYRDR